jgi:hypothetical protein
MPGSLSIKKHKMPSLLRSLTDRFTPNASTTDLTATEKRDDGFLTAKGTDALFARTKPESMRKKSCMAISRAGAGTCS